MGWCAHKLLLVCKYFLLTWVVGNTNNELTMKLKKKKLWEVKKVEIMCRNLFKKNGCEVKEREWMVVMLSWSGGWRMEEGFEHVCKFQRQNHQWRRDLRWDTEGTTQKHRSREMGGNEAGLMGGDKNTEWLPDSCPVRMWGVRQEGVCAEVSWDTWEQGVEGICT